MNERKSWEFAAIPIILVLLGCLAVILWAFSEGVWAWVAFGVIVLIAAVVALVVYMARPHHPPAPATRARPAGAAPPSDDGVRRVLVIADRACAPSALGSTIGGRRGPSSLEAFVIAPALGSRSARWTGDEHAYQEAQEHLDATLAALTELDIAATGRVGAHDPLQAVEDGLREFAADEVVFAVHAAGETNWLEDGVVDAARARYPIPVTELPVPGAGV
jgi:hypothetical protein